MKALSLSQPYASLVAAGLKTIETRKTRIHYRGPLVICSTKTFDFDAWRSIRTCAAMSLRDCLAHHGVPTAHDLPLGKVLALVDVVGCRELVEADWPRSFFFAPFRWAWELANIRPLKLRDVRGMNGLFPLDERLVAFAETEGES